MMKKELNEERDEERQKKGKKEKNNEKDWARQKRQNLDKTRYIHTSNVWLLAVSMLPLNALYLQNINTETMD